MPTALNRQQFAIYAADINKTIDKRMMARYRGGRDAIGIEVDGLGTLKCGMRAVISLRPRRCSLISGDTSFPRANYFSAVCRITGRLQHHYRRFAKSSTY